MLFLGVSVNIDTDRPIRVGPFSDGTAAGIWLDLFWPELSALSQRLGLGPRGGLKATVTILRDEANPHAALDPTLMKNVMRAIEQAYHNLYRAA